LDISDLFWAHRGSEDYDFESHHAPTTQQTFKTSISGVSFHSATHDSPPSEITCVI
jgi:hypothetical protein